MSTWALEGVAPLDAPEGAEHTFEISDALAEGDLSNGNTRGGVSRAFTKAQSNLGFASLSFHNVNLFAGRVARCMNGVGVMLQRQPSLNLEQQYVTGDRDPIGLYRFETLISWAANANFECGLVLSPTDVNSAFPTLITGAGTQPGIILEQNNGAPRLFTRRDNVTFESIPLNWPGGAAATLNKWTAVKLEIRAARLNTPASLRLYLGGVLAVTRYWTGAHALPLLSAAYASSFLATSFIVRGNPAAPTYAMAVANSRQSMAAL